MFSIREEAVVTAADKGKKKTQHHAVSFFLTNN